MPSAVMATELQSAAHKSAFRFVDGRGQAVLPLGKKKRKKN